MGSKRGWKSSVKSVQSVRERTPQQLSSYLSLTVDASYFSQSYTEGQNTQTFTETLSQPKTQSVTANRGLTPSSSPNGEGSDHRGYPSFAACVMMGMYN